MPLEEKAGMADFVVDNSGSLNETELQVEAICQALRLSDPAPGNAGDSHPSR